MVPKYRVWPDYTVQSVEDGEPPRFMSDDFIVVDADDEEDAIAKVKAKEKNFLRRKISVTIEVFEEAIRSRIPPGIASDDEFRKYMDGLEAHLPMTLEMEAEQFINFTLASTFMAGATNNEKTEESDSSLDTPPAT